MILFAVLGFVLLTLSLGTYLIAPLFGDKPPVGESPASVERQELATRQAALYATLKELDFDLATGKLTGEDHLELKERYTAEAVEILRKLNALSASAAAGRRR